MSSDWLSPSRVEQAAMGRKWLVVSGPKATLWGMPGDVLPKLEAYLTTAEAILSKAQSSDRTPTITAECKIAFDALTGYMRFIKSHYFLVPPLTEADLIALGLKPKDTAHTPVPAPTEQAEADILRPGVHLITLAVRIVGGGKARSGGYRIYWGVMPPGGADVAAATGANRELMRPPLSGDELPFSKFTKRRKETLNFDAENSGKTAYFCIRLENSKGDPGPWGPIFSAIIP